MMTAADRAPESSADGTAEIACPQCGESDDLAGEQTEELIRITCGACGSVWDRDPRRRCPRCDSADMYPAPVAVIEKSRGSQLSIVSTTTEYLCWSCDRDLIDDQRQSGTALMPDQLPT
ncbi:MAG: hypothetical protein OER95_06685 [Acidimicrobiia bacterium]|nr:hypothetical protein [Acidimicrobiia bacterium]